MTPGIQKTQGTYPTKSHGGQWYILAASMLWGTNGTAQALAPDGYDPLLIGTLRLLIGALALSAMAARHGAFSVRRKLPMIPIFWAGLGVALYQLCFFAAVSKTGVAVGTIVTIGSSPVFAGILGYLIHQERPGRVWMLSTLLAIAGCALLSLSGENISVNPVGILLALGAGGAYALYAVFNKGLIRDCPPEAVTALIFAVGSVVVSPFLLKLDPHWLLQSRSLFVVLHLGIITTAGAYTLFTHGLRSTSVATAVTLTLAEPLTATVFGIILLGERLTVVAFFGIALLFSGLALLSVSPAKIYNAMKKP